jgi:hypothetical protein
LPFEERKMTSRANWIARGIIGSGALSIAASASAVMLSSGGTGQVLLFPYFTANANNNTLISIVNTKATPKALRVRFAEGENGRDALSLNVYLNSHDVWTATIGLAVSSAATTLVTSDKSCTVPAIPGSGVLFSNAAFSGASADAGSAALSRTHEGYIEVIEMGTLTDATLASTCTALVAAWQSDGLFSQNPLARLANATGGLYGNGYIINVEQGTVFAYAATALEDFRVDPLDRPRGSSASVALHAAPGDAHPNLSDALSDPARRIAIASVQTSAGVIAATYSAPSRAIDAVSAALSASTAATDYSMAAAEGSTTAIVFAYPTRRFYTDPAYAGSAAITPFTALFAGIQHDVETETVPLLAFDRSGFTAHPPCGTQGCDISMLTPGTSVELLALGTGANAVIGSDLTGNPGLEFKIYTVDPSGTQTLDTSPEGWLLFDFDGSMAAFYGDGNGGATRFTRPSLEGWLFAGLPVIGFTSQNLVNANARPGVLANYSSALPQRIVTNCYLASDKLQPSVCD